MTPIASSNAPTSRPPQPPTTTSYCVIAAHGGAGASTVACWLRDDRAAVYELASYSGEMPPGCLPIVVSRYTAREMLQASTYLASWPSGIPRPWLVLIRDAPLPPPRPAVFRRRALGARVLGVSEVPYLVQLRAVDTPEAGLRVRAVAAAALRLRRDVGL